MKFGNVVPVLIVGLAALPGQALADARDDIVAGIQRCGVINDNRVWLDCVYGAVQPMRAQLGLQPAPEFQQRLVPPAQASYLAPPAPPVRAATAPAATVPATTSARPAPRKRVGFFNNLLNAPPVSVSKMASFRYERNGAFVVALENGQQWRQANVIDGVISWDKPPASYTVTITQGAFGSYSLRTSDNPRTYKVELVR